MSKRLQFRKSRIRSELSDTQWSLLAQQFSRPANCLTATDISLAACVPSSVALALMLGMNVDRVAELGLLVYHSCQDDPVATRSFRRGFQPVPWRCRGRRAVVVDEDALTYEACCRTRGHIEFV